MVDQGRASRLLRGVSDRIARLSQGAQRVEADRDSLWLDGIKYLFITTIEGCIDVSHHIASSESWKAPDTNAAAIRLLGEREVVDPETAESIARAVGFRNVLVHQYTDVDDTIVIDALEQLDDFRRFVQQTSAWVLRH